MKCQLNEVKTFNSLLQALILENGNDFFSNCKLSPKGIRFSCHTKALGVYGCCWIPSASFGEYEFDNTLNPFKISSSNLSNNHFHNDVSDTECIRFSISLLKLTNCLYVFGANANMTLEYLTDLNYMKLILSNKEGESTCTINVLEPNITDNYSKAFPDNISDSDSSFYIQPMRFKEVINSLEDILDLDSKVMIQVFPPNDDLVENNDSEAKFKRPAVSLLSSYQSVNFEISLPHNPLIFPIYNVTNHQKFYYTLKSLKCIEKALSLADSCRVCFIKDGICYVNMLMQVSSRFFMQFIICPVECPDSI